MRRIRASADRAFRDKKREQNRRALWRYKHSGKGLAANVWSKHKRNGVPEELREAVLLVAEFKRRTR